MARRSTATPVPFGRVDRVTSAPGPDRAPQMSVIVPSVNGPEILRECLGALEAAGSTGPALEVIVVDRCGAAADPSIRETFRSIVVVQTAAATSIPAMRAIGIGQARAPAVAVIEDHVLVPASWSRRMLDALEDSDVVGGTVVNAATDRTTDWAAFLCEYSHLLASRDGALDTLTGNNVVYRRRVLDKYVATLADGRWEDHLHEALRRDGVRVKCDPSIVVGHKMRYRVRDYLAQRYWYSRSWAGLRGRAMTAPRRTLAGAVRIVLPPVLLYRIVRSVLKAGRYRAELARSLPLLAVFVCAWAAGEMVGFVAGPGDALVRVS